MVIITVLLFFFLLSVTITATIPATFICSQIYVLNLLIYFSDFATEGKVSSTEGSSRFFLKLLYFHCFGLNHDTFHSLHPRLAVMQRVAKGMLPLIFFSDNIVSHSIRRGCDRARATFGRYRFFC
jgi:hypothetical protein